MKKSVLLLMLLPFAAFAQTLSGTYNIGAAQTYKTITAAVNDLNTKGVSGPVTFLLTDAAYTNVNSNTALNETFPITINAVNGSSATNTVTFKPAANKTVSVEATNINNYTGAPAVFKLNGADNVIFDGSNATNGTTKNLTINNKDVVSYVNRSVLWIASNDSDGAKNITVKNCIIRQNTKNSTGGYCIGIYSGSNTTGGNNTLNVDPATADNGSLTVTNNKFSNVKQGVYINGGSTVTNTVLVNKNDIGSETNTETIISPATFNNVNSFEYSDNYVYNIYRDTNDSGLASSGITITGASTNGSILRNNMKDLTKTQTDNQLFGGIVLASTSTSANILVANNFILNVAGAGNGGTQLNGHGIAITSGGGYKIYFNTVQLNTNQAGGGYSSALYVGANTSNLDVRNNIFSNNQTNTATRRTAIQIVNTTANINTVFTNLDNNDYWSNDKIGYVATGGSTNETWSDNPDYFVTLSAFTNATGKDKKTVSVLPIYVSATDLHVDGNNTANAKLDNGGVIITSVVNGVTTTTVKSDIDGQLRNTTTPDMGADEFGAITAPTAGQTAGIYCDSTTTWNGTKWTNGNPTANTDVIFSGNYTSANNSTLYACSVYVINSASVNFVGNSTAIVTHSVNVNSTASLTFESSSNLIQIENDANTGTATIKRNSSYLQRLDYTLWTAPVVDSRSTGYQSLQSFSPLTTATRFYNYTTATNSYTSVASPSTTKFAPGKSILIRMPNTDNTPGYNEGTQRLIFNGAFQGTPNNGNVRIALDYGSATTGFNAVGNPYPSPLNVTEFINQNLDVIEGTLWIWRKTNDITKSSYSTVNLTGYVANKAPGGSSADGNNLIVDPYTIATQGALNTAQGFIVKAKAAKELVFNNSMRLQTHSTAFFKSAEQTDEAAITSQYDRVWLNVNSTNDNFTQTLVGYSALTTTGYDNGYDSKSMLTGDINFYSVLNTDTEKLSLAIQTRGAFNVADAVTMGFIAANSGTYTIAIDHADGQLALNDINILLVDGLTGITKNLKDGDYTFTTEAGTFEKRFKIVYSSKSADGALGTDNPAVQAKQVIVYKNDKQVSVQAPSDIKSVVVYDMLGKVLFQKSNIEGQTFSTSDINAAQQVIIVNVTLDNNTVISKKIMN